MGIFAELDADNKVTRVMFSEQFVDAAWFAEKHGGRWVEATTQSKMPSYNAQFNEETGVFRPAPPAACWVWDEEAWEWKIPVAHPDPNNMFGYRWDDDAVAWVPHKGEQ